LRLADERDFLTTPLSGQKSSDPFVKMPHELLHIILKHLSSEDIANLRLVTRAYTELPVVLFRDRLLEDMPSLWEMNDLPAGEYDWCRMYNMVKHCWLQLKGLKNRKRVWKDITEIMTRIEIIIRGRSLTSNKSLRYCSEPKLNKTDK
jgi:hypothetical protein